MLLRVELLVQSDMASGADLGLFWRARWCTEQWPRASAESGLTREIFLEFFPILIAVEIWGKILKTNQPVFRVTTTWWSTYQLSIHQVRG